MNTIEPSVQDRKKFDLDLKYGQVREKYVADMLQDKKIEVKSERDAIAASRASSGAEKTAAAMEK